MLSSKYATVPPEFPRAALLSFANAGSVILVGAKTQRSIDKNKFLEACPDLAEYAIVSFMVRLSPVY